MKEIYKLKEELLELYRTTGLPLVIASKTVIGMITIVLINLNMGALEQLKGLPAVIGVSVLVGVLPISLGTIVLMCFTIGHIFAVSYVAAAIVAGVLVLLFSFGKLFSPKETYLFVAAFIISLMGGTYAAPLVLGMLGSVLGVVPLLGGVIWYSMIAMISDMKSMLSEVTMTEAIFTVLEGVTSDSAIFLSIIVVGVSYIVVTVVKKSSLDESWKVGLIFAAAANVILMFVGGLFTSASVPYFTLLVGTVGGVVLGLIVEIFVHNVDYRGVEHIQFEDDEYCYIVKAIPKKDPPRALEIPKPTKAELREQNKNQPSSAQAPVNGNKVPNKAGNKMPKAPNKVGDKMPKGKKETPQEKRARERAEQKANS